MANKIRKPTLGQFDQNPVEIVRDISHGVKDSFKHDVLEASVTSAWDQLLGIPTRPMTKEDVQTSVSEGPKMSGDLVEGEEVRMEAAEWKHAEPAINYAAEIIHAEARINGKEQAEQNVRVEKIRIKIAQIANEPSQGREAQAVVVETAPVRVGIYHESFFESMLNTLTRKTRQASEIIEHKVAKKDYWSLTRKHGTSFSLSGERVVAQQVG